MPTCFTPHSHPGEYQLHVHPLALPAFDTLAASGCTGASGRVGRAVHGPDKTLLVFSGFGVLAIPPFECYLIVEETLAPEVILHAAWQDVADTLRLLRISLPNRRAFAQALAQSVPADRLSDFQLPPGRDPAKLLQQIRANRTDGGGHRQPTIFQSVLQRLQGRDT